MHKLASILVLITAVAYACDAAGQEERVAEEAPAEPSQAETGAPVSIRLAIVEYLADGEDDVQAIQSPDQVDAWLKELGEAGKLVAATKLQVSTTDGQEATTQVGERAAVVTGRTMVAQGGPVSSYEYIELGTLVRATPRVGDDGTITLELQIEKSDISPLTPQVPVDEDGPIDVVPPHVVRLNTQSTLRLDDGKTHAAYRMATSSPQGMVETVLFVTAIRDERPAPAAARFQLFRLKGVDSDVALRMLQQLFQGSLSVRLELDSSADAVMAYAAPNELEFIESFLEHLDEARAIGTRD